MAYPKLISPLPIPSSDSPMVQHSAVVEAVEKLQCLVRVGDRSLSAAIPTHIWHLKPGQRVVVVEDAEAQACLIVAAWPTPGTDNPIQFDAVDGTLRIHAPKLALNAVGSVELVCGDASLKLSVDGKAQVIGKDVLSSATASNRIEGASIDLN